MGLETTFRYNFGPIHFNILVLVGPSPQKVGERLLNKAPSFGRTIQFKQVRRSLAERNSELFFIENIPKPRVAAANLFADMTEVLYIAL